MTDYVDLPGIAGGRASGTMAGSVSGILLSLRSHRVVSAAADYGAVAVWRDDDGNLRCAFMRHMVILESQTFKTKAAVRRWLTEWLPAMRAP